jgi:hypothetical protein
MFNAVRTPNQTPDLLKMFITVVTIPERMNTKKEADRSLVESIVGNCKDKKKRE